MVHKCNCYPWFDKMILFLSVNGVQNHCLYVKTSQTWDITRIVNVLLLTLWLALAESAWKWTAGSEVDLRIGCVPCVILQLFLHIGECFVFLIQNTVGVKWKVTLFYVFSGTLVSPDVIVSQNFYWLFKNKLKKIGRRISRVSFGSKKFPPNFSWPILQLFWAMSMKLELISLKVFFNQYTICQLISYHRVCTAQSCKQIRLCWSIPDHLYFKLNCPVMPLTHR